MNQEIATQIKELVESGLEGLDYVYNQYKAGNIEQSAIVFTDIVQAFSEIEQILIASNSLVGNNQLETTTDSLKDALERMVSTYEGNGDDKVVEFIEVALLPRYKAWQSELDNSLSKYRAS